MRLRRHHSRTVNSALLSNSAASAVVYQSLIVRCWTSRAVEHERAVLVLKPVEPDQEACLVTVKGFAENCLTRTGGLCIEGLEEKGATSPHRMLECIEILVLAS